MDENQSKVQGFECESCGSPMVYDKTNEKFVCKSCGRELYLMASDRVRIEKMHSEERHEKRSGDYKILLILLIVSLVLILVGIIGAFISAVYRLETPFGIPILGGIIMLIITVSKYYKTKK